MNVYLDETGYTGQDLLNPDQPVFVAASTNVTDEVAAALVRECFADVRARELKHSRLCMRERGQDQIIRLLHNIQGQAGNFAVSVAHKEFVLVGLLIDFWVEAAMREDGVNLYERGANIGLCNLTYLMLKSLLPAEECDRFFRRAQEMLRNKSMEAYGAFGQSLRAAQQQSGPLHEILDYIVLSDFRLGGYEHLRSIPDRLTDLGTYHLMEQVSHWSDQTDQAINVIHDESSALAREQHVWDVLLDPDLPDAVVGQDRRTIKFPLRVDSFRRANSEHHLQLQLADLLAGAFATYLRNRVNGETDYRPEYAEKLEAIGFLGSGLAINCVWPTADVAPEDLGAEGTVLKDSATHIAQILRDRGVEHPAAPVAAEVTLDPPTWFDQSAPTDYNRGGDD